MRPESTSSTRPSTVTPCFGTPGPLSSLRVDTHGLSSFVADVYTELILRFAKSINSGSATLFKAKISPWATGAAKKAPGAKDSVVEEPEDIDTAPKKLEWVMTNELKMAVVRLTPMLQVGRR